MELVKASEFGLEQKEAEKLTKGLPVILKERELLEKEFEEVSTLEITYENLPKFAELRKKIMRNRTQGIQDWHKKNKAYFLAGGKFVDAIRNKEIAINKMMEEKLEEGEKHFERVEQEKKNKLNQKRLMKVQIYLLEGEEAPDFSEMDEDVFDAYLEARKKRYEKEQERIRKEEEERKEEERKDELKRTRQLELAPYVEYIKEDNDLREMSEEDYVAVLTQCKELKAEADKEQERIKKENAELQKKQQLYTSRMETLKPYMSYMDKTEGIENMEDKDFDKLLNTVQKAKEVEEKANKEKEEAVKKIRLEREGKLQPYMEFVTKFNELLDMSGEEFDKSFTALKAHAEKVWKEREEAEKKRKLELEKQAELEAELKSKKEAEEKAEQEQAQFEQQRKSASDEEKLEQLIEDLKAFELPEVQGEHAKKTVESVKALLGKISKYVEERQKEKVA